ncbi:MAG: Mth938-like domain-containing protein [Candidatus Heimdallarchaeaceae archaeon]
MRYILKDYSFGKIKVNDSEHTADLIVGPDFLKANWWRKEGHKVCLEDLAEVENLKPEILIIGTGAYGRVRVPQSVIEAFEKQDCTVKVLKTKQAVELYNLLTEKQKKVVAALHLTC